MWWWPVDRAAIPSSSEPAMGRVSDRKMLLSSSERATRCFRTHLAAIVYIAIPPCFPSSCFSDYNPLFQRAPFHFISLSSFSLPNLALPHPIPLTHSLTAHGLEEEKQTRTCFLLKKQPLKVSSLACKRIGAVTTSGGGRDCKHLPSQRKQKRQRKQS